MVKNLRDIPPDLALEIVTETTAETVEKTTMLRTSVGIVGYVCHGMLPTPTDVPGAIGTWTPGDRAPARLASILSAHVANRKNTLDSTFSGSANSSGASTVLRILAVGRPLVGVTNF